MLLISASQLIDLFVGGLAIGCVYSLIALGFAMIMRATSIIHFAQGELMMLGCMCGLTSLWLLPQLPLLLVLAIGMLSSGAIAVAMELAVYRTLRRRRVPIINVITATVGMSILCINAARIIWGSEPLRFPELFAATAYDFAGVRISPALFGPMSGNAAAQGQSIREAVEMVVNSKNAAGGVLGRQIELVIEDDAGKPEEAAVVARRFATRDQVALAIGSVSSPASLAAAQVFREEELPQIVVSGTAQRITTQGNEWVFRSAVPDRKLVADMVDFINEKMPKLKRFGFLYVNDDFGKGGYDAFVEAGKKYGMSITTEERYSRGDLDFTAQLTRIRATNPDAVVEWSRYTEGALIHRQIKQMGWDLPRFGSDGIAAPAFLDLARDAANGVIYPTPFSPATSSNLPAARTFIELTRKTYNKPPDFVHAQAFDAINIAIAAIERANSAERTAIRNALRQTDHQSVRGPFKFDQKGDPTLVTHMVRIVDIKETDARS